MSNVLDRAREAIALITRGKEMLDGVRDAIADGREAVNEHRLDQLKALLAQERIETQEAADNLAAAIAEARKRNAG